MKPEIINQINSEIINKISSSLYSFSYTDEEPGADVVILQFENIKIKCELQMDLKKNSDGIITNCSINAITKSQVTKNNTRA